MQTENKAFRTRLISFLKATYIVSKMIYSPDEDGATPLFVSSYLGYVDFVDYFIETHPYQIGVTDKKGRSSLFVACENGHIAAVEHLLKYSEDVNAENAEKTTALSATCLKGHIEVAELLLDNKADITRTNKLNQNAFHFTCLNGNILLVSLLFGKYNADIIVRANEDQSHLRMGHKKGDTQTVKQLIEVGIHINQKDINGRTPLHLACKQGHYETVKLLLNSNRQTLISRVDTRTKDNYEWSILHSACYKGHIEIVEFLIDIGMNVNDRTINGCTPLFLACMKGHLSIVEFLLDLKDETSKSLVDTTINHESGWSVVHSACYHGHIEIVKLLTDAGLSVNDRMNNGCTPLFLACQKVILK
ncbi:unnamed protein product [Mytilus edulis]|uniref:Uncharacterized protein n=1 Tax=Mytilus edulis TaxID=6550 RepID=A0A8S3TKA3_MYTED|nr:unnamed protein product [Mytilus edulis]